MILRISIGKPGFLSESLDFYRIASIQTLWFSFHRLTCFYWAQESCNHYHFWNQWCSDFLSETFNFHRIVFSSDHDYYWSVKWIFIVCSIFIVTDHLTNAHISKICIFEFLSDHFHRFAFLSDFSWDFGVISTVVDRFFLKKNPDICRIGTTPLRSWSPESEFGERESPLWQPKNHSMSFRDVRSVAQKPLRAFPNQV